VSVQRPLWAKSVAHMPGLVIRWAPVLAWAVLIYVLSDQPRLPQAPMPLLDLLLKKAGHLTEYGIFAVLLYRALGDRCGPSQRLRLALAWTLAVVYAVSDELHQAQVPGRTAASIDVVIDGVGALVALFATRVFLRHHPVTPARDDLDYGGHPVPCQSAEMPHTRDDRTPRTIHSDV
jgi:VanZ family protein